LAKKTQSESPPAKGTPPYLPYLAATFGAFGRLADRIGISFTMLLVMLFTIWKMGSERTQDDFIRELLFADVTHTRYLSVFVGMLLLIIVLGGAYIPIRPPVPIIRETASLWRLV
jgi:hypothetical protein